MKSLPTIEPMPVARQTTPFDQDAWLFEAKRDGFRAIAHIQGDNCRLIGPDNANLSRYRDLARVLPGDLNVKNAILDGELVVLDQVGSAGGADLLPGRQDAQGTRLLKVQRCGL